MSFPDITAVVVAYNAGTRLQKTVDGVRAQGVAKILVVDSGSTDGSPSRLHGARVIGYETNVGPCVTRNRGLREADTAFVLWIDDDMELAPGSVLAMRDALLAEPRAAMAGPLIYDAAERTTIQYAGGRPHFTGLSWIRKGVGSAPPHPTMAELLTSGCLLVRREVLIASGAFYEPLFYLMEDVELSLRLRAMGHDLVLVPRAEAWNLGASVDLSLTNIGYPKQRAYWQARNRWLLLAHSWSTRNLLVLLGPLLLFEGAHGLFGLLTGHGGAVLSGKRDALRELKSVRAAFRAWQVRRVRPERNLLASPTLTLTDAAARTPLVARCSRVLDGTLRLGFLTVRGWLS